VFATPFAEATIFLPISPLRSSHRPALSVLDCDRTAIAGRHAVFTTDGEANISPELFSRADGDIYLTGLNTMTVPVPEKASEVQPEPSSIEVLIQAKPRASYSATIR
jgi:hypothetical protein